MEFGGRIVLDSCVTNNALVVSDFGSLPRTLHVGKCFRLPAKIPVQIKNSSLKRAPNAGAPLRTFPKQDKMGSCTDETPFDPPWLPLNWALKRCFCW